MRRINYDQLLFTKNKFYEKEGLFTGVAYKVDNGIIYDIIEIIEGAIIGDYNNDFLPDIKDQLCVDISLLDNPNGGNLEPYLYEGKLFNGIACDFIHGACIEECYYIDGEVEVDIGYSISGAMISLFIYENHLFQEYEFYESGQLSTVSLELQKKFRMLLRFKQNGEIYLISISTDYFEYLPKVNVDILHNILPTKESLSDLIVDKNLRIIGEGITCDVINHLAVCSNFSLVENLEVFNTSLNPDCMEFLDRLNNIHLFDLADDRDQMAETAKNMKLTHPKTKVLFNHKELLL